MATMPGSFDCPLCKKRFAAPKDLRAHRITVHGSALSPPPASPHDEIITADPVLPNQEHYVEKVVRSREFGKGQ